MNNSVWKWNRVIALLLSVGWVMFTFTVFVSWGYPFGDSRHQFSGIIIPLFLSIGLSITPFALWTSNRTVPQMRNFLSLSMVWFGLLVVWILVLITSYHQPISTTCTEQDYRLPLTAFWIMMFTLFVASVPKNISEVRAPSIQYNFELLLAQVGVLSLYTTPWIAGLHCGTYFYEGHFLLRGIIAIFVLTCTPILIFLGVIGVLRWNRLPTLTKLSTIMSLVVSGCSCAFLILILLLI